MTDQKRTYRKQHRAELEEQTRRRITESTVELHGTLGPARTSISAVAEHAGVRRSTVYRHFADEAALFAACTAHWTAANPPPDLAAWAEIDDPDQRLRAGLGQLYAYYRQTEPMLTNLHRDEQTMPIVRTPVQRVPRLSLHRTRHADDRTASARRSPPAGARSDRPRSGLPDLALADRRAGTRRPPGGRADGPPRRRGTTFDAPRPR